MNFLQPQCSDEDCCGNGIDGSSCKPFTWINACSIGWYITDRCDRSFLFRIKKDGTVIVGPSNAHSYSMTPPADEVAEYSIEYCEGTAEPCSWSSLTSIITVDTTSVDACPMGIKGQTYILGARPSDGGIEPTTVYAYCQSSIVVRAAARPADGQTITHLWIDDKLFTNTNGALSDDEALVISYLCETGLDFAYTDVPFNDTAHPQLRVALPIPFTKGSFSVRARQTNGMIIGCTVEVPGCTVYYNAASTTLPTWSGLSLACDADGAMPFGFMSTPSPVKYWCEHFESTLDISGSLDGVFAWYTCLSSIATNYTLATLSCTYNFKCNGQIRWIDPADSPTVVYSGTYSFDHTVTWTTKLVLFVTESAPGSLEISSILAVITSDVVSTITGHNDWPTSLQAAALATDYLTALDDTYSTNNNHVNSSWFVASDMTNLFCSPPPAYDGDTFNWNWQGPQLSSAYWGVEVAEWSPGTIAPSPLASSSYVTSAVWPADTSFSCDLPEGSYDDETESADAAQFQV